MRLWSPTLLYDRFNNFDPNCGYVTSWAMKPKTLLWTRALLCLYVTAAAWGVLIGEIVRTKGILCFSRFTNLSAIGLIAYFSAATYHTFTYIRNVKKGKPSYMLQKSWRPLLRYWHRMLYMTIVFFPLLAMALYWGGTDDPKKAMQNPFQAWSTVTNYALNPAFSVFELLFTNGPSLLWVDFIPCLSMLGLYVGWVYFIKAITDLYIYSFLDLKQFIYVPDSEKDADDVKSNPAYAYALAVTIFLSLCYVIPWILSFAREKLVIRYLPEKYYCGGSEKDYLGRYTRVGGEEGEVRTGEGVETGEVGGGVGEGEGGGGGAITTAIKPGRSRRSSSTSYLAHNTSHPSPSSPSALASPPFTSHPPLALQRLVYSPTEPYTPYTSTMPNSGPGGYVIFNPPLGNASDGVTTNQHRRQPPLPQGPEYMNASSVAHAVEGGEEERPVVPERERTPVPRVINTIILGPVVLPAPKAGHLSGLKVDVGESIHQPSGSRIGDGESEEDQSEEQEGKEGVEEEVEEEVEGGMKKEEEEEAEAEWVGDDWEAFVFETLHSATVTTSSTEGEIKGDALVKKLSLRKPEAV